MTSDRRESRALDAPDLRLAVHRGYFVLATPGLGGVRLGPTLLRYDPSLSKADRAALVTRELRKRRDDGPLAALPKKT